MMTLKSASGRIRIFSSCAAIAIWILTPSSVFGLLVDGHNDAALTGALVISFDGDASDDDVTVRAAGNDRASIEAFSSSATVIPEPNFSMLLSLGLLTLAGSRIRNLQAGPGSTDSEER